MRYTCGIPLVITIKFNTNYQYQSIDDNLILTHSPDSGHTLDSLLSEAVAHSLSLRQNISVCKFLLLSNINIYSIFNSEISKHHCCTSDSYQKRFQRGAFHCCLLYYITVCYTAVDHIEWLLSIVQGYCNNCIKIIQKSSLFLTVWQSDSSDSADSTDCTCCWCSVPLTWFRVYLYQ